MQYFSSTACEISPDKVSERNQSDHLYHDWKGNNVKRKAEFTDVEGTTTLKRLFPWAYAQKSYSYTKF